MYLLHASLPQLNQSVQEIADQLSLILFDLHLKEKTSSSASEISDSVKKDLLSQFKNQLMEKMDIPDLAWASLQHKVPRSEKEKIENLKISGLGFDEELDRFYPEASMAASLLGFVGKDKSGQDKGYFGLEGYYDLELKGRPGILTQEKDVANNPILFGSFFNQEKQDGNTLVLHLDRAVQFMVENKLKEGIDKYKAKSGYVIIMDPDTGGIIAMASLPTYDQKKYFDYNEEIYKNPAIADLYEPGSTFKIFVMAAALDKGVVDKDTKCDICSGSFKIDKYTIKTWDDKYHPDATMTEVLQHSDNVGMVFVGQRLGINDLWDYLDNFGFSDKTDIDLQEEISALLKKKNKWSNVDLATISFGQGIATTGIQILTATSAIANGGNLLKPHMVKTIISGNKTIEIKPRVIKRVIKPETAKVISDMMVNAVDNGETKWTRLPGYKVAGKTGTAQIPIAGHYDTEKTIASFVGFAPADKPKFVMLVTLREPSSSPWASETAAPLFFKIAKELFTYYGIQPD